MSTTTFDSELLQYIKEEADTVLEKKKGKFKYNQKDAQSKKGRKKTVRKLKKQLKKEAKAATKTATDLELDKTSKKVRAKNKSLFRQARRGSKLARKKLAGILKKEFFKKLGTYAAGAATGPIGTVIGVVGTATLVIDLAKAYAESQIGGIAEGTRALPGRSQAEIADDIARLQKRLKQHEALPRDAFNSNPRRVAKMGSWDKVKQNYVREITALKKERNEPQKQARFNSLMKALEQTGKIDYSAMDPASMVSLAQNVGGAVAGMGVDAFNTAGKKPKQPKKPSAWSSYKIRQAKALGRPQTSVGMEQATRSAQEMVVAAGLGQMLGSTGADGKYGSNTFKAIKALQKQLGVKQDGIVGPNTIKVFKEKIPQATGKTQEPAATAAPAATTAESKSKVSQMILEKYIKEETKGFLKKDGIVLQEKIALGKTGRITYHGVKGNFRGGQFQSRSIYMEIRKQQGIIQRIGSGIKEIYLKFLQKTNLYKLRPAIKKAAERIANFFRTRGASMLSRTGPGAMKVGAIAKAFVVKIGSILGSALGAVPGIGWAALGATAAGMLIYKYYFDDGPGGIAKETLAGAGKKTSKYRAELDKIFEKAFVEKAGFFDSLFGGEDDYSMVKKTRGESSEQLLRRLKGSDKLSGEEKERAEELMALIAQVQIATRIQQVGKKLKEFPNMDPNQVYGQVVGGLDPATGGNKPKPKPKPGGGGKAARQRALAKKIGMSVADIQNKLVNYFKKGSNTFSVKENKGAGINPDGKYGGETEQAIKDFQNEFNGYVDAGKIEAKKLTPDGLFGPATLAAVKMVEQNKDVFALSKLNPKYSNKGTQVAGRGATGIPGGPKFGPIKPEDIPKYSLSQDATDRNATSTNGKVLELIAKVEGENAVFNLVDGGDYKKPVLATGKSKIINNLPNWLDAFKDLKKNAKPDIALRDSDVTPSLKPFTESKRGKTTMNKTKLINMIKEEIERVLSENQDYLDRVAKANIDFLNADKDAGDYAKGSGAAASYYQNSNPLKDFIPNIVSGRMSIDAAASKASVNKEEARKIIWNAVSHDPNLKGKLPSMTLGQDVGISSSKAPDATGVVRATRTKKGKEDIPKSNKFDYSSLVGGRTADGEELADIVAKKKKIQSRLTNRSTLRKIQAKLVQMGFLPKLVNGKKQIDGSYGANTMGAIMRFQTAANKNPNFEVGKVDGLAGRKTRTALRKINANDVSASLGQLTPNELTGAGGSVTK